MAQSIKVYLPKPGTEACAILLKWGEREAGESLKFAEQ